MIRKWFYATDTDKIPAKEGRRVVFGEYHVALFNLGGEYLAVDNRCPHKQGPLADGIVSGKAVFCPLHNWKISLETGCALSGGEGRVAAYPVKVIDGKVYVAFEEGKICEEENGEAVVGDEGSLRDVN